MKSFNDADMLVPVCVFFSLLQISLCIDITYRLKEENSPGTYVGNIATDLWLLNNVPSQDHSRITFNKLHQRGTSSPQLFNITKTGKLYTTQKLDAESLCIYNTECFKTIKIAVRKDETFMKILKIKVIIEDINDHQPEFPVKQINIHFSEDDRNGVERSIPSAIDRDVSAQNSKITYELGKKVDEPFRLSVTKRVTGSAKLGIILDEKLDREVKDTYTLQVIAKNGKFQLKQSVLNIQISVTDENDNLPVFTQNIYNISIKNTQESFRPVMIFSAKDLDSGENGRVTYHLSSETSNIAKTHFKLNEATGEISVQKNFTSEYKQTYKLFVEARDGGQPPLNSIAIVLIKVINQQNNGPVINIDFVSELSKNVNTISERIKIDSFIAYVSVIDNDIGQNGEVECNLRHDTFLLLNLGSNEYKITLKKPVDREIQDLYDLTITCEDKGSPPLQTKRRFSIKVMDVNDVQPQFIKDTFKFLTYENGKSNFPIGFINATDLDLGPGGQLTFSLKSESKYVIPFQITDYGFISTIKPLDREKQEIYKFKVFVKDNGTPSLNNTANVIVEILDKNDNAPYFTFPSVNPFSLDVHHHLQSKNDITVLRASDRDSHLNAFLRYEILKGNDKHLFTVNPYTGVLSFSRIVYQNDARSYNLQLVVKDSGTPVLSATTTLSLTLTVSNKTSRMLTAVHIQSDDMIDVTLMIIIVAAAVIISVAIVVSITLCIVRCNNDRNSSHTAGLNISIQSGRDSQNKKPVSTTIGNRNTLLVESRGEFYPQYESGNEWITSTIDRRPPSVLLD